MSIVTPDTLRPTAPVPDARRIPTELKEQRRWVLWRYDWVKGKWTKAPYTPGTTRGARSNDPQTWRTFDQAWTAYQRGGYDGIGFMLGDGYVGLDFDACVDPATGDTAAWALPHLEMLTQCGAYLEASPSGTGYKAIVRGAWRAPWHSRALPEAPFGGKDTAKVEAYDDLRYFTLTGDALGAGVPQIVEAQEALDTIALAFAPPTRVTPACDNLRAPSGRGLVDDRDVVDKARSAANGPKFDALWHGDTSAYADDHSAADMALCSLIAYWTGPDAARIDHIFRQSGLYREKWERTDYRERTIARALERTEFYEPPHREREDGMVFISAAELAELRQRAARSLEIPAGMTLVPDGELATLREDASYGRYVREAVTDDRIKPGPTRIIAALADIVGTNFGDDGYTAPKLVRRSVLASKTGLSPSTISLNLPDIERLGTVRVERRPVMRTRTHTTKDGRTYDANEEEFDLWVSLGPLPSNALTSAQVREMAQRARAEAQRKACPHCGGSDLVVDRLRCKTCGRVCTPKEAEAARTRARTAPLPDSGEGHDNHEDDHFDMGSPATEQTPPRDPLWNPYPILRDTPLWNPEGVSDERRTARSHVRDRAESPTYQPCPGGCGTPTFRGWMCGPCEECAARPV